jgi:YD repeat-containing protein
VIFVPGSGPGGRRFKSFRPDHLSRAISGFSSTALQDDLVDGKVPGLDGSDYVYDLVGKIQHVDDRTGTYAFAYDNMGRLIGTTTNYSFSLILAPTDRRLLVVPIS